MARLVSVCTIDRVVRNVGMVAIRSADGFNAIDSELIDSLERVLDELSGTCTVLVLGGSPSVFCSGADIGAVAGVPPAGGSTGGGRPDPQRLYGLWKTLRFGPCISVAHVRGETTAGGLGFAAACDIVVAAQDASFGLSEMTFDIFPACVLPFLAARVGVQRANELVLTCRRIDASQALEMGLVDHVACDSEARVRQIVSRVGRHSRKAIAGYKRYARSVPGPIDTMEEGAVVANLEMFDDPEVARKFERFQRRRNDPRGHDHA